MTDDDVLESWRKSTAPVTRSDLMHALDAINGVLAEWARALDGRIGALESQAADLQTRGLRFVGVHQRALDYRQGDVCTAKGGLWIAVRATRETPGDGTDWQLAVKPGAVK